MTGLIKTEVDGCAYKSRIKLEHILSLFLQLSSFFSFMLDNFTQLSGSGPGKERKTGHLNNVLNR